MVACNSTGIRIIVNSLPSGTPETDNIYVAGNFNTWNPADSAYLLQRDKNGNLFVELPTQPLSEWEFKFTRGSWQTVECEADGSETQNRRVKVTQRSKYIKINNWRDFSPNIPERKHTCSKNVSFLADSFFMPQLNRYRKIIVYLPPSYTTSNQRYPVVYMHDGQNLFDEATSLSGEWKIDETLDMFSAKGIEEAIIIGIYHGDEYRIEELTPWENTENGGGNGNNYLNFIVETLKPYVDSHLRTSPEREFTAIGGSSLGGLISFYAALKYPQIFSQYYIFSPSFWFSEEIFKMAEDFEKQYSQQFYFLCGEQESQSMVADMKRMTEILQSKGFTNRELHQKIVRGGKHNETFWSKEFPQAYKWFMKRI